MVPQYVPAAPGAVKPQKARAAFGLRAAVQRLALGELYRRELAVTGQGDSRVF